MQAILDCRIGKYLLISEKIIAKCREAWERIRKAEKNQNEAN
jgi:hypothetical protein